MEGGAKEGNFQIFAYVTGIKVPKTGKRNASTIRISRATKH